MVTELVNLPIQIVEGAVKLLTQGTQEDLSVTFTLLGRKVGADIKLYLAEAQGQKGQQPAKPQQPGQPNPTPATP